MRSSFAKLVDSQPTTNSTQPNPHPQQCNTRCYFFQWPTLVGRPINYVCDEPRPGPGNQILIWWAAARPGPSIFQRMGHGPAQPITFSKIQGPARPDPSHGSEAHETRALYGPARQLRRPVRRFDGPAHEPAHVLFRTKRCMCIRWRVFFVVFFPVWTPWDSCFRPIRRT